MQQTDYPPSWNQVIYFVSDIYSITRKFPPGRGENLGMQLCKAAVNLSAGFNHYREEEMLPGRNHQLNLLMSAISILETYLILIRKHCFGIDLSGVEGRLGEMKEMVLKMREHGETQ